MCTHSRVMNQTATSRRTGQSHLIDEPRHGTADTLITVSPRERWFM